MLTHFWWVLRFVAAVAIALAQSGQGWLSIDQALGAGVVLLLVTAPMRVTSTSDDDPSRLRA